MNRPRLLITGSIQRSDILVMFDSLRGLAQTHFVEYEEDTDPPLKREIYAPYGPVETWAQARSAKALINKVSPDLIVAYALDSYNQVALRIVARERGIKVVHLEHGIRFAKSNALEQHIQSIVRSRRLPLTRSRLKALSRSVGTHAFALRSISQMQPRDGATFLGFLRNAQMQPWDVALLRSAEFRRADAYVSFSEACIGWHRDADQFPAQNGPDVRLVGIPQFDFLANLPSAVVDRRRVLLIDHMFHNGNLFGWTLSYREQWIRQLVKLTRSLEMELLVKRHPGDTSQLWNDYAAPGHVTLINNNALREALPTVAFVMGSLSTMLLPIVAQPHVVMIAMEIHPSPEIVVAAPFINAHVAQKASSFDEVRQHLQSYDALLAQQSPHKARFTEQTLYRFDGRSGERLRDALLELAASAKK